jgi:hypothetical protein
MMAAFCSSDVLLDVGRSMFDADIFEMIFQPARKATQEQRQVQDRKNTVAAGCRNV